MECWNSLHNDDTPFPKQSKDLVNHSLSVAFRTMQPNVYIVARFCFNGPVERRRGPHSRNKGFLQHVADAATISHTWVNTVLKPLKRWTMSRATRSEPLPQCRMRKTTMQKPVQMARRTLTTPIILIPKATGLTGSS